ncbi:MAG: hypothetical protein EOO43_00955 [Flavobacterium sp.]|nr:MAG: hypothetical protein EOO43_00955 [Flavobacterium sp.]
MNDKQIPIINIFTYKLPKRLSQPIYKDFEYRYKEALAIIIGYPKYAALKDELPTVELLLALSIFYNHIIANLDAAVTFHGLVTREDNVQGIRMGSYILNADEIRKLQSVIRFYHELMEKYNLSSSLWNYRLTLDFVQKLIIIKTRDNG